MRSLLRSLASTVIWLVLSCAIGFVMTEVALRLLDIDSEPQLTVRILKPRSQSRNRITVSYHCFPSDPHGEFTPAPEVGEESWHLFTNMLPPTQLPLSELEKTPWCVEYKIWNGRLKLRDWPPARRARAGQKRLVVVGDSFTRGSGVPSEKTLPSQLEKVLQDPDLLVINAGFPGADLSRQVEILRRAVNTLRPAAAIVVFIANDIHLDEALKRRQDYINDLILIRDEYLAEHEAGTWYAGRLRLIRILGSALEMRKITRATIDWYLDSYDPNHNAEGLARLAADLATLAEIPDCPVGLVLYPLLIGFEREYPLAPVHDTVSRMALEAGLPVLDLAPFFADMETESLWAHPTDHHPNGRAHAIAAGTIADWLRNDVPQLLPPSPS